MQIGLSIRCVCVGYRLWMCVGYTGVWIYLGYIYQASNGCRIYQASNKCRIYQASLVIALLFAFQRDNIVKGFRSGKIWVLICTELMGRGIDFKGVALVINYDFPTSAVSYIHRIGRTGRAGHPGKAITFFTEADSVNLKRWAGLGLGLQCLFKAGLFIRYLLSITCRIL